MTEKKSANSLALILLPVQHAKNKSPENFRLEEIVRAAEVLGIKPYELLIDPDEMKGEWKWK